MPRGFFAIGIEHTKTRQNIGTLWRTAGLLGASFIFTVGARYSHQGSDTRRTPRHIPLFHFVSISDLIEHLPHGCPLVGVELDDRAQHLHDFRHPKRACYLLGAEDHGLTTEAMLRCHDLVRLPGSSSMNVSVAGSIVIYDRWSKHQHKDGNR